MNYSDIIPNISNDALFKGNTSIQYLRLAIRNIGFRLDEYRDEDIQLRDRILIASVPAATFKESGDGVVYALNPIIWHQAGSAFYGNAHVFGIPEAGTEIFVDHDQTGLYDAAKAINLHVNEVSLARLKRLARLEMEYAENPYGRAGRKARESDRLVGL